MLQLQVLSYEGCLISAMHWSARDQNKKQQPQLQVRLDILSSHISISHEPVGIKAKGKEYQLPWQTRKVKNKVPEAKPSDNIDREIIISTPRRV